VGTMGNVKRIASALALLGFVTFGLPALASAYPPPIKHPDYRGHLKGDPRAVVTIDVVPGGAEVRFQARRVRLYCDHGTGGRRSFETRRAAFTRGFFAFDFYYYSSNGPFTADNQAYYAVHGARMAGGNLHGRLAYFGDSLPTEGFEAGSDCSSYGPRSWIARPVR